MKKFRKKEFTTEIESIIKTQHKTIKMFSPYYQTDKIQKPTSCYGIDINPSCILFYGPHIKHDNEAGPDSCMELNSNAMKSCQ